MISRSQREAFATEGFVVLENVVDTDVLDAALRSINTSLGNGIDPARMTEYRHQSFCPELRTAPEIMALSELSGAWAAAEELVGSSLVHQGHGLTQIALRFPLSDDQAVMDGPHIDGMYSPDNGLVEGDIYSFTLLVGVALSDVRRSRSGNFVTFPGSHVKLQDHFAEEGPRSLLHGMPDLDFGPPVEVEVGKGDVVLAHYQLAHTIGVNTGPDVRYMTFNRLETESHGSNKWECMTDIWREWPAMRAAD